MNYIIIAPHADDEIIGCHDVLLSHNVTHVLFSTREQAIQARLSALHFQYLNIEYTEEKMAELLSGEKEYVIFCPDPIYEYHPLHKEFGMIGIALLKVGVPVVFYTTNMNAPYMFEVTNPEKKHLTLNEKYPGKADLWKYDHKYFLFEGYTRWIFNNDWK